MTATGENGVISLNVLKHVEEDIDKKFEFVTILNLPMVETIVGVKEQKQRGATLKLAQVRIP